jgi:hypothetical protein
MAQSAANLVDHVLPEDVPLRQFVLTLPFELRAPIAYDRELMGGVGRIFVATVLGFYARKTRERGISGSQSGAFTVVQRTSSDLKCNPHYHTVFLDGVFAPAENTKLEFHPLGSLSNTELGDLMQAVRIRVLGYLARPGVIESSADLTTVDDEFAEREPALAALARASVSGLAPAGPERRARPPVALHGEPGVRLKSGLNVAELGFSLHAATVVGAHDRAGREALCKYVLRPPIATERVQLLDDGLVRLVLKRPFTDGTVAVDLDPLSLLVRLCTMVPPPKMHLLRFAGVLASAHKMRPLVVPPLPPSTSDDPHAHPQSPKPATHRCHYWRWAALLKRSLGIDGDPCDRCGARMKLRALVIAAASIQRLLRQLGEPVDPPVLAPARGPPFFKSRALRRRLGELAATPPQAEMFDA